MSSWSWIAASCKGTSHVRSGTRLQDAQTCFFATLNGGEIVAGIVSDGAGSAAKGGEGASLVCWHLKREIREHFASRHELPDDESIRYWVDRTRDRIFSAAKKRALTPRDFAATLVLVISDGSNSLVAHVGDGCAVMKSAISNEWIAPIWPEQGAYASTTFFVTDDIEPRLRIARISEDVSAIALFSDGLERLALDFSAHQPLPQFFEAFVAPVVNAAGTGRNHALSTQLKSFLNSERVNARTDDDKSFILAAKR